MCGIWGYIGKGDASQLFNAYNNIRIRGPERSSFLQWKEFKDVYLGFHRLSIVGTDLFGDQPFVFEDKERKVVMGCNGEIYNFKHLIEKHKLKVNSDSDSESILQMYLKFGIEKTIKALNGEYAFYILDISKTKEEMNLYLGRDQCGIRPLYIGEKDGIFAFSSEMKGLMSDLGKDNVK